MMQSNRDYAVLNRKFTERLERDFRAAFENLAWFRPGLRIGVGVSGGADSVALLTLLHELRAELGVVVSAVHFNHQLRGKVSDGDEKFVASLAEKFALTLHVGRGDVAGTARREKTNLEDAARRSRYKFFGRLAEQGAVDVIVTAHTMDDQAETVLAHIFRGTGIAGLAGIHPVSGCVLRPLLTFRRAALRKYLRAKKQKWREDASNRDATKSRARMRKKLLPLLEKQFNPAAIQHLAALAERAQEQSKLIDVLADQLFEKHVTFSGQTAQIPIVDFLHPCSIQSDDAAAVLQAKLVLKITDRTRQRAGQISAGHIEAIVRLAKSGESGKRLQIPGGIDVLRQREILVFQSRHIHRSTTE